MGRGAISEFHDLAETLLNHESGGRSAWGNLGDWTQARSYPEACTALADRLGRGLALNPQTRLLDLGFGCGDQLLHWRGHYGVQDLVGLNLSRSQTAHARQRVTAAGHADLAPRLHCGDAGELQRWAADSALPARDTLLALDCAYHFPDRARFLAQAAALLPAGGRLGLTDLVLARDDLHPLRERLPLRLMARLSHLPAANLVTAQRYRQQWQAAGFEVEQFEDLTPQVFRPFGEWLDRYRAAYSGPAVSATAWSKYRATAAFLRWAQDRRVLAYVVCIGRRR